MTPRSISLGDTVTWPAISSNSLGISLDFEDFVCLCVGKFEAEYIGN